MGVIAPPAYQPLLQQQQQQQHHQYQQQQQQQQQQPCVLGAAGVDAGTHMATDVTEGVKQKGGLRC